MNEMPLLESNCIVTQNLWQQILHFHVSIPSTFCCLQLLGDGVKKAAMKEQSFS